ncbi:MBL fold metallo-hydrolase [Rickettsia endosymbiont of Cardiosporidium cionae]|uniref:MBL fold metallo-hydrolase n=1 Tax=Rickettsia endosymbiont of Cardiosporidium cionae TaxID=2777155 RepID=UPI001893350F|nr:MBL fold metallo-hydrolase [Rickettsia endosymbiont of Cardiosporidium cionae]KAF8818609.1 MBL fold metallo-hydrolase [Rickettsia endosymbiont of Cardiosporidium cionae]
MLKIKILGCGASLGVPIIGCNCTVCKSSSDYNKRTRSAIYIYTENTKVLVDFGCDIKQQLIRERISQLDAAILTHYHADHVAGIDDIRIFSCINNSALAIYTDYSTTEILKKRHDYLFKNNQLKIHSCNFYERFNIKNLEIQFFAQHHGKINSIGIKINDFVYSCDVESFPEESEKYLYNINYWVLDCIGYEHNHSHAGLDKILDWNKKYTPNNILLTGMHHTIDYHKIQDVLPNNIQPLYDGFEINL